MEHHGEICPATQIVGKHKCLVFLGGVLSLVKENYTSHRETQMPGPLGRCIWPAKTTIQVIWKHKGLVFLGSVLSLVNVNHTSQRETQMPGLSGQCTQPGKGKLYKS